jgi:aldose 1-epimerase
MEVKITNFGGKVVSIVVPDKNGTLGDVVLGYSTYPEWEKGNAYFGALIGRYGNRIAGGRFSIDGVAYQLAVNNGPNALHGGPQFGFNNVLWGIREVFLEGAGGIELTYTAPDGEEGYPGTLDVSVIYLLNNQNELIIRYAAKTDKATPINLTHHSFFNLRGAGNGDILDHSLMICADAFTPIDSDLIPTGELRPVAGTPFDFRDFHKIGERINEKYDQLEFGNGYDHNFVLRPNAGPENTPRLAAVVFDPESGRQMETLTTEPGMQLYTGNFLDGSDVGKGGLSYGARTAFCLETQHFPDSPNKPHFPNTILRPGVEFRSETIYRFSVRQ